MVEYAKEIVKATFLVTMFLAYCKDLSTISMFQGWNDIFGGSSDMAYFIVPQSFFQILPVLMFYCFPIVKAK